MFEDIKVGDEVLYYYRHVTTEQYLKIKVVRVTKTQIVCVRTNIQGSTIETKFRKSDGWEVGYTGWGVSRINILNEEGLKSVESFNKRQQFRKDRYKLVDMVNNLERQNHSEETHDKIIKAIEVLSDE